MQVLYERCAGLDVHKDTIVACVRCVSEPVHQEVRSFGATTTELLALADWLGEHECTPVAMEATGVYCKPVWHILEPEFELVLANAAHIRNVPGRKTDVNDAMWIADLLAHGLIRSSFVPPPAIQDLRDLTRTRKQLVREVSQHALRIQKGLADANLKLGSVLSDVPGQSGRAMLDAIVAGEADPGKLAALAQGTWIKTTLVTAAWSAVRVKTSYLHARFLRIKARRGAKKAILAVAASMPTAAYHMLRDGVEYADLGADFLARQDRSKVIHRLLKRLQDLGCDVPVGAHVG